MKTVTLGSTGITTPQNAFGALPVQRDDMETSIKILRRAFEGGMTFFDTARAYSDSEEKIGRALSHVRQNIIISTKSGKRSGRLPRAIKMPIFAVNLGKPCSVRPFC